MGAWQHRKIAKPLFATAMIVIMLMMAFVPNMVAYAGDDSIMAYGYRVDDKLQGSWNPSNLLKTYSEGEWAAYHSVFSNIDWENLENIGVRYDFYGGNNAIFFDLIRNVSIAPISEFPGMEELAKPQLPDYYGYPQYDGTPYGEEIPKSGYALYTLEELNEAQRSPNFAHPITDPPTTQEYYFNEFDLIDFTTDDRYMTQVHIPDPDVYGPTDPLYLIGTDTDAKRVTYITREQIEEVMIANPTKYPGVDIGNYATYPKEIILYFQLHIARTWIWNNTNDFCCGPELLAYVYQNEPTDVWGGYQYTADFLNAPKNGAAEFPGASGHSYAFVNNGDGGEKTLPLPNVAETTGRISGHKYDAEGAPLAGWTVYLRTKLYAIEEPIETSAVTDVNGYFEFLNLPYNLIWRLSEEEQEGYLQVYPDDDTNTADQDGNFDPSAAHLGITSYSGEEDWWKKAFTVEDLFEVDSYDPTGRGLYGWSVKIAPPDNLIETDIDFANDDADPIVDIVKTGDELSKIGDDVTYTFTVTNLGNVDLTLVNIDDDQMGIIETPGTPGGLDDVLPVGMSQSFSVPWTIPGDADDPYVNIVTANYEYHGEPVFDMADDVPTDDHSINLFQPSIEIEKTADPLSKVGDSVDYTITVRNTSSADTPDMEMTITDPLLGINEPVILSSGGDHVINASRVVQPGDPDPLINTAMVTASPMGFPNEYEAEASAETDLFQPDLWITKTGDELSKIGDEVTYVITVGNSSSGDSPNLVGRVFDPQIGFDQPIDLAPGEEVEFIVPWIIPGDAADPYDNIATATASPVGFPNLLEASDDHSINLFQPSIEIEKTADPLSKVGDSVDYTITVRNTSSADTPDMEMTITDPLLGINEPVTLSSGGDHVISASRVVQPGDPDPLINTAMVTASPMGFPNEYEAEASAETDLFQPDLWITKTGDELSKIGDEVTYVITVGNSSSGDSPNLVGRVFDPQIGFDQPIDLAPGEEVEFIVPWIIPGDAADPYENIATATASPVGFPNLLEASDDHSINLFQPSIEIEKTADPLSKVGDSVDYTITVRNTSSADTPDMEMTITDPLLGINEPVTLSSGGDHVINASRVVQPGDPDPLINTAMVTASPMGFPNEYEAEASAETDLFQPDLWITKTGDELSKIGDEVTYVITVGNSSSGDSPNLVGRVFDPQIGFDQPIDLAPGEEVEFIVPWIIPGDAADPYDNIATATASPVGFPNLLEASDDHSINLFQPSIEIEKTADPLSKVGDSVDYTITVRNTSSADTPDMEMTITDPLLGINEPVTLSSGGDHVISASRVVQPGDPDPLINTAMVTASPMGFPNEYEAEASAETDLFQPDLWITKTGDELSKIGDEVTYVITVGNASSGDSPNLVGRVFDPQIGFDQPIDLAPGEEVEFIVPWIIPGDAADPYENIATATASPVGFPNLLEASDDHSINLFQPSIEIEKTADPLSKVGDSVDYTITVRNTSSADTPDMEMTITDPLLGINEPVTLSSGGDHVINASRVVQPDDPDPLINTAMVTASPMGFPNEYEAEASAETDLFQPDLWITKTGDELSKIGDEVTYVITVGNASSGDSPNLVGRVFDPQIGFDQPIDLAPGEEVEFIVPWIIPGDAADPYENIATATASPVGFPNLLEASDDHSINLFQPSYTVEKTADEISKAGDYIHYWIRVNNTSSDDTPMMDFVLTDEMLDFAGLLSDSDKEFSLGFGEDKIIEVDYLVTPEDAEFNDPLINEVSVWASPDGFPNEYTVTTSATTDLVHPEIMIEKDVSPTTVMVGDWVTYEITITNTGDWPLENVVVTDDTHQALLDALATPFPTELDVGESATRYFDYQTTESDPVAPDPLVDWARVDSNPVGLPNEIWDEDDAEIYIIHYNDETAWGRYFYDYPASPGAIDFRYEPINLSKWGWTNGPFSLPFDGPLVLELYADQDIYVGTVTFEHFGMDMMRATYEVEEGIILEDVHLYVGGAMLPPTDAAPGQFPYTSDTNVIEFSLADLPDEVYIAAHAVVLIPTSMP